MARTKLDEVPKQYAKILKRLRKPKGHIARKNARTEMKRLLTGIWNTINREYPAMRKDGSTITHKKKGRAFCYACDAPFASFASLATHVINQHLKVKVPTRHPDGKTVECFCGKKFKARSLGWMKGKTWEERQADRTPSGEMRPAVSIETQVTRHLASLKDLKIHMAAGILERLT